MRIYQIINIPKGLSPEFECDCQDEYNSGYTAGLEEGYDKGYDSGYTDGAESVDCEDFYDSGYTEGYDSGYTSGYTDGQASVDCTDFYNSGVTDGYASGYTSGRTDGYDDGWQPGYDSGRTDGEEAGYDTGYEEGKEYQKTLLVSTAITSNGTYEREDGFNQVVVNVPSMSGAGYTSGYTDGYASGYTDGSDDGFDSGYTSGKTDGYASGYTSGVTDGYASGYTSGKTDAWQPAYDSGYTDGAASVDCQPLYDSGYTDGYSSGRTDGYDDGWTPGYNSGYTDGINAAGGDYASGYTDGFDAGYDSGVTDGYASGYTSGKTDGFGEGYDSGYTDGVASVDCQPLYDSGYTDGYESGHTDGYDERAAMLTAMTITANGSYESVEGWSAVTVNVSGYSQQDLDNAYASGHTSGVTDGAAQQKALLASTAFTTNGTYTRTDGWSSVTVNVPQTGYTQQDLDNAYASGLTNGYDSGWTAGYDSGYTDGMNDCTGSTAATYLSFNVPSYVTDGAETSVSVSPTSADVDIVYESNNESAATIDSAGTITVLEDGAEVTFCVTDLNSGMHDCQTRTVYTGRAAADVTLVYELKDTQSRNAQLSSEEFLSTVDKMYIDGVEVQPVSSYTFDTYGHHTVEYYISSNYHQIVPSAFARLSNPSPYGVIITPRPEVHPTFEIGASSFFSTQITAATIAEGVTSMGSGAFNNTAIRHISIPNSLTIIPSRAFVQNKYLETVNLGTGVTNIYSEAFMSCATLSSIVIPDTVQAIYQSAFLACSGMTEATIGTGVTTMGTRVFEACTNLRSVNMRGVINGGVIPGSTFKGCTKLADCVIPSGTTVIDYDAFNACHLSAITVPEGVTDIKNGAFLDNSFATAVTLPSTIVNIGTHLGSSLATFGGLTINTRFTINATTPPTLGETSGSNASLGSPGVPIYVPAGSVEAYKASSDYVIYKDYIQAIQ